MVTIVKPLYVQTRLITEYRYLGEPLLSEIRSQGVYTTPRNRHPGLWVIRPKLLAKTIRNWVGQRVYEEHIRYLAAYLEGKGLIEVPPGDYNRKAYLLLGGAAEDLTETLLANWAADPLFLLRLRVQVMLEFFDRANVLEAALALADGVCSVPPERPWCPLIGESVDRVSGV